MRPQKTEDFDRLGFPDAIDLNAAVLPLRFSEAIASWTSRQHDKGGIFYGADLFREAFDF
jgi:hypothetical protein